MIELNNIFNITYGTNKELCYLNQSDDGINFVSRTSKNNGVSAKVELIENVIPNPANTISVALGSSSVLSAFLQEEEYYSGRDICYLTPIEPMDKNVKLYYCMCIKANKYKYSFGRQANSTLGTLLIPSLDEIPEWVKIKELPDVSTIPDCFLEEGYEKACWYLDNINIEEFEKKYRGSKLENPTIDKFDYTKWASYNISDLFGTSTGRDLTMSSLMDGEYNVISHKKDNNGVSTTSQEIENRKLYSCEKTLTLADRGNFFATIQQRDFYVATRVKALEAKFDNCNKFILAFIAIIINAEQFRFSYARNCCDKLDDLKIKLPSTKDENNKFLKQIIIDNNGKEKEICVPDYNFMEDYMKSLQYSRNLEL